jgi:hypothetical protein
MLSSLYEIKRVNFFCATRYVSDISRRKCFFALKIISENISREMRLNLCESTRYNMFLKRINLSQGKLQVSDIAIAAILFRFGLRVSTNIFLTAQHCFAKIRLAFVAFLPL